MKRVSPKVYMELFLMGRILLFIIFFLIIVFNILVFTAPVAIMYELDASGATIGFRELYILGGQYHIKSSYYIVDANRYINQFNIINVYLASILIMLASIIYISYGVLTVIDPKLFTEKYNYLVIPFLFFSVSMYIIFKYLATAYDVVGELPFIGDSINPYRGAIYVSGWGPGLTYFIVSFILQLASLLAAYIYSSYTGEGKDQS